MLLLVAALAGMVASRSPASADQAEAGDQCIANALAGGSVDAITIPLLPCSTNTNLLLLTVAGPNLTTTPTLQQIGGGPSAPITLGGGGALAIGDLGAAGNVALLTSTGSSWVLLNPTTSLPAGSAATNLGWIMPTALGAKCDGTTVDAAAFTTAAGLASEIELPPGVNCVIRNLTLHSNQVLNCHGSVLTAASGASWIVRKNGSNAYVKDCVLNDPTLATLRSTTLSGGASPGSTVLSVTSSVNFAVNMVASLRLDSGAYWTSKVTAVGANSITLADPVPASVTAVVVATGGSIYSNGSGVLQGGVGPPATFDLTTTAGAITGATVDSPGLYSTAPGATSGVWEPSAATLGANGGSLTVTLAGASSGAPLDAAFGVYLVDDSTNGTTENLQIPLAPVGIQIMASTSFSIQEDFDNFNVNAAKLVGFAKFVNVSDSTFRGNVTGYVHGASAYGGVGVYIDGRSGTAPSGGNHYEITALGFESGLLDQGGSLDIFDSLVLDTSRNYGGVCNGCTSSDFPYVFASFTGPNAVPSLGGVGNRGVGLYFGSSAINNGIGKLTTANNASDLHLGDQISAVWLGNTPWGPSSTQTGSSYSIQPGFLGVAIPTSGSLATLTGTQYFVPGSFAATENGGVLVQKRGVLNGIWAGVDVVPGGSVTYTVAARVAHWGGSSYGSFATVASCVIASASKVCTYGADGVPVYPGDKVDLALTPSSGAFPANQKLTATINIM